METHVFNEETKILEPIDNSICMCCGKTIAHGQNDNYVVDLYKEDDRTNLIVYRNVKFKRIAVEVTRCSECKNEQSKAKRSVFWIRLAIFLAFLFLLGFIGIYYIGIVMASTTNTPFLFYIGVIVTMIGGGAGFAIADAIASKLNDKILAKKNILSEEKAAERCGIVKELLAQYWSFEPPTA